MFLDIVDVDAEERAVVQEAELLVRLLSVGGALIIEERVVLFNVPPDCLEHLDRDSVCLQPAVLRLPESSGRSRLENLKHLLIELVCFQLFNVNNLCTYLQVCNFLV